MNARILKRIAMAACACLVVIVAAVALSGCAKAPVVPGVDPSVVKFTRTCNEFSEVVSDLAVQFRIGNLSRDQALAIDPYVDAGAALCGNERITNYTTALDELETILIDIAEERANGPDAGA